MKRIEDCYILFQLATTTYALGAKHIRHLEMVPEITPVPTATAHVEGIVSLRGQILPVLNLRRLFGMQDVVPKPEGRLIVVEEDARVLALLVDNAREFLSLDPEQVQPIPQSFDYVGKGFLQGTIALKERMILLLNLPRLLSMQEPGYE